MKIGENISYYRYNDVIREAAGFPAKTTLET